MVTLVTLVLTVITVAIQREFPSGRHKDADLDAAFSGDQQGTGSGPDVVRDTRD